MRHSIAMALAGLALACASPAAPARNCDFEAEIARELAVIEEGERIASLVEEANRSTDQRRSVAQAESLLSARDRAVSQRDLQILDRALALIATEALWDRADDRVCYPADTTWSLFCALRRASEDVLGQYQHRRAALQEVRFAVEEATVGREYAHRLMEFNNDPTITLNDVRAVIRSAHTRVAARLDAQRASCREHAAPLP